MPETRSAISQATTLVRRPVDPLIAELNQWRTRNLQAIDDATHATLAELHEAFDDAIIARDRLCDVTQRRQSARAKPRPTILDAEVALVHELGRLVGATARLVAETRQVEAGGDLAMGWSVQWGREVERQHRRILPPPAPVGVWDEEGGS